jgi:hypothetical protein
VRIFSAFVHKIELCTENTSHYTPQQEISFSYSTIQAVTLVLTAGIYCIHSKESILMSHYICQHEIIILYLNLCLNLASQGHIW